jgi:hypothetical protein
MPEEEYLHLNCQCENLTHTIRFHYDPEFRELQVEMHLVTWPWYRRILLALTYLFNATHPTSYQYDCALIKPEDYPKLVALLEKAQQGEERPG